MAITLEYANKLIDLYNHWKNKEQWMEEIQVTSASIRSYWLCYGAGRGSRPAPYLVVRTNGNDIYTAISFVEFICIEDINGKRKLCFGERESTICFDIVN